MNAARSPNAAHRKKAQNANKRPSGTSRPKKPAGKAVAGKAPRQREDGDAAQAPKKFVTAAEKAVKRRQAAAVRPDVDLHDAFEALSADGDAVPDDEAPATAIATPDEDSDEAAAVDDATAVKRCGTVAIVGRPNVGKSTLLNAILGQKIAATTHKPQTTRRALRGVDTRNGVQLVFVDTPGVNASAMSKSGTLHKFMSDEAYSAARDVDVVCFLVEARGDVAFKGDLDVLARMRKLGVTAPMVLVINKVDNVKNKEELLPFLAAWGQENFVDYIPISARKKNGIDRLLRVLGGLVPEGPHMFGKDELTDAKERDICAELIREKVMLELQDELPYRAAVVVEAMDESRRDDDHKPLVKVAAVIHVEKDSQKAMVIGAKGQRIKAIGQRSRMEIERLLGCQVMLELLVRVESDWTTSEAGMRKLGYSSKKDHD